MLQYVVNVLVWCGPDSPSLFAASSLFLFQSSSLFWLLCSICLEIIVCTRPALLAFCSVIASRGAKNAELPKSSEQAVGYFWIGRAMSPTILGEIGFEGPLQVEPIQEEKQQPEGEASTIKPLETWQLMRV